MGSKTFYVRYIVAREGAKNWIDGRVFTSWPIDWINKFGNVENILVMTWTHCVWPFKSILYNCELSDWSNQLFVNKCFGEEKRSRGHQACYGQDIELVKTGCEERNVPSIQNKYICMYRALKSFCPSNLKSEKILSPKSCWYCPSNSRFLCSSNNRTYLANSGVNSQTHCFQDT